MQLKNNLENYSNDKVILTTFAFAKIKDSKNNKIEHQSLVSSNCYIQPIDKTSFSNIETRMEFLKKDTALIIITRDGQGDENLEGFAVKPLGVFQTTLTKFFNNIFVIQEFLLKPQEANKPLLFFIFDQSSFVLFRFLLFALYNVNLSGGSKTKRHILSPLQHRLAQMMVVLFGSEASRAIVKESYYDSKVETRNILNLSNTEFLFESPLTLNKFTLKQWEHLSEYFLEYFFNITYPLSLDINNTCITDESHTNKIIFYNEVILPAIKEVIQNLKEEEEKNNLNKKKN